MTKEVYENKAQGVVVTKEMWRTMNEKECPKTNGIHFMERGPTVLSKEVLTVRVACLKAAVDISMPEAETTQVLSVAEAFEKWILR